MERQDTSTAELEIHFTPWIATHDLLFVSYLDPILMSDNFHH